MLTRRDLHRLGAATLSGLTALILLIPGASYLLHPLFGQADSEDQPGDSGLEPADTGEASGFHPLTRLSQLTVGRPRSFPVIASRTDAWVHYPAEPIGSVWLLRRDRSEADGLPGDSDESSSLNPVTAYSSECPHLGCSVKLTEDASGFACPCHNSGFTLAGDPTNAIPPRPLDQLEVRLSEEDDPLISVRFQRFRTLTSEKIPLG